jgi:radical SAM protein with 4Fe4S-binding SPASM domain
MVSAVASDKNWQQLPDFKRYCLEELGVDRFRLTSYCPTCSPWISADWTMQPPPFVSDPTVPVPETIEVPEFGDLFEYKLVTRYDAHQRTLVPQLQMRNHCGAGRGGLAMLSNGDIYPCQLLCKPQFLAGNVFQHSFEEIYQSEVLESLRRLTVDNLPGCATCDVRYICGGGCRATALECYGSVQAHNTYFCEYQHRLCVEVLWYDSTIPVQQVSDARERYLSMKQEVEEQMQDDRPADYGRPVVVRE